MRKSKITTEMWIKKAIEKHGTKFDYNLVNYIGSKHKVTIICPIHGEFLQTPAEHVKGSGCSQCVGLAKLSTDEFIKRAIQIHGSLYDYSKTVYINATTKLIVICPIHGEFLVIPSSHLRCLCKKCSNSLQKYNRKTTETFIIESKLKHGDKFDYNLVEYVNTDTKVKIICPIHGEFLQTPQDHLTATEACFKCSKNTPTTEEYIKRVKKIFRDLYDYSLTVFIDKHTKIKVICKKHGMFEVSPYNHQCNKTGCPVCKLSKGELQVKNLLDDYNISYLRQYKFNDCTNPKTNKKLSFDFYISDMNLLIEYDGIQHHTPYSFGSNQTMEHKISNFENIQYLDNIKTIYSKENNITLLRIRNIKDLEIFLSP